jgi:predicted KAP-like P-loop ATPase
VTTYYVVTVNVKAPNTPEEQFIARSMLFSMKTTTISRVQMKELLTTFRRCEKLDLSTIDEPIEASNIEELNHPVLITSLDELDKLY